MIKWLIKNHKHKTFATLTGFITGSLLWIWPFKNIIDFNANQTKLHTISCPNLTNTTDLYIIFMILLGVISIILIEYIGRKYKDV